MLLPPLMLRLMLRDCRCFFFRFPLYTLSPFYYSLDADFRFALFAFSLRFVSLMPMISLAVDARYYV